MIMKNEKILSALIGLMGAINNSGKTPSTDALICKALLQEDSPEIVDEIHKEKFAISPNCATCQSPCGNTSDYDMSLFTACLPEVLDAKMQVVEALQELCRILPVFNDGTNASELPDVVLMAISYLGYDLAKESYEQVLADLRAAEDEAQR